MAAAQLGAVVAILGVLVWRIVDARSKTAGDIRALTERYRAKGLMPASVHRFGTDWMLLEPRLSRAGSIRIYEIMIEQPDGEVEHRILGVSRGALAPSLIWRRNAQGEWEALA